MPALPTDCESDLRTAVRCCDANGDTRKIFLSMDPEGAGKPEIRAVQSRARYLRVFQSWSWKRRRQRWERRFYR